MVGALTAAGTAAMSPVSQAAPAATSPPAPVTFVCNPTQARADLLNYELPDDTKIYNQTLHSTTFHSTYLTSA
jgi:hypothetical protein